MILMKRNFYWAEICPVCKEGQLVFQRNITNNRIYVHCGECEMGWAAPKDLLSEGKGFLVLLEDFEALDPSLDEIKISIWGTSNIKKLSL
jgi:hypothetical protein